MSAYYASPGGPAAATVQEELAPVLVAFAGPAPQSRLTVLIRALMVIPHIVVLWALATVLQSPLARLATLGKIPT